MAYASLELDYRDAVSRVFTCTTHQTLQALAPNTLFGYCILNCICMRIPDVRLLDRTHYQATFFYLLIFLFCTLSIAGELVVGRWSLDIFRREKTSKPKSIIGWDGINMDIMIPLRTASRLTRQLSSYFLLSVHIIR